MKISNKKVASWFRSLNIKHDRPGFYNDPEFLRAEKRFPRLLEDYADFVESKQFGKEYLKTAREIIQNTAEFLYGELEKDGKKGACVDASMALSAFLDLQQVWNYVVKGSLTLDFDEATGFSSSYLQAVMMPGNPAVAGHSWVCAPPFRIVDVTVGMQQYHAGKEALVPGMVLAEAPGKANVDLEDLAEPEAILAGYRTPEPALLRCIEKYGAYKVTYPSLQLKYICCAIGGYENLSLNQWKNLCLSGKHPAQLYADFLDLQGSIGG